ncbi:MAG TPA: hypothetical protein VEO56_13110, partial [Bacteroidota bacterium]|nr:hypothetical protein [Bacteroidota bacterium]
MKRRTGILLSALLGLSALHAHPLGIFSVNRYASVEAGREEVRIFYVMDVAEIPSIAEIAVLDAKGDGTLDATEKDQYAKRKIQELLGHMQLTIDGKSAALRESEPALEFPEGQGGLRTVRLTFTLLCTVPQGDSLHTLSFKDDNFASGRGWKEIIARSGPGARIMSSTVPNTDLTEALRAYPADRLEDPLSVSEATIAFGPGTSEPFAAQNPGSLMERAKDGLGALVSARELTL